MARHMSEPVKTFSVGFREAGEQNELEDARLVAEYFGTDHHELELSFAEDTVDLEDLVWHLDEPLADLSSLGFLALCELAVEGRHRRALGPGGGRAVRRLPKAPGGVARRSLATIAPPDPGSRGGCRSTRAGPVQAGGADAHGRRPGRAARLT